MRHLSVYDFFVNGTRPIVLLSTAESGFSQEQVLGNYRFEEGDMVVGRATVEIHRERVLHGSLEETVVVNNYNPFPVSITLDYHFAADFADIFEVRGHKRHEEGMRSEPLVERDSITYRYLGLDGLWRRTAIVFDQVPDVIDDGGASFTLQLPGRSEQQLRFRVIVEEHASANHGVERLRRDYARWRDVFAEVRTSDEVFDRVMDRSLTDLRMLWTRGSHGQSYIAAGTPWYATLFGRDSAITALQLLPYDPRIARESLAILARYQGQDTDHETGEQPGKILHEMRENELSLIGELPYRRYYGSVDSTPLFLVLAAEYLHWTADLESLEVLLPPIKAALHWIEVYGDLDGDGLIEYPTDSGHGLRNQGWKDSVDAIEHEDGTLCEGPIALPEVQGYVYLAYLRLAPVFDHIGEHERAAELRSRAGALRLRFEEAFWLQDAGTLALALGGDKRPSRVMSSNAGQALWSGILSADKAARVRDRLFETDMFSGWGIRTLSQDAVCYFPLGYHLGTVWPHDNGIIAQGLKQYGFENDVNRIATALFDAASVQRGYRLPELFGGHARTRFQPPVPYPVACRPQAWTAGTVPHLLQAIMGLRPDALNGRLEVVNPRLPSWLTEISVQGMRLGPSEIDLSFISKNGTTRVNSDVRGDARVEVLGAAVTAGLHS
jgi:glycogen debranching enzyme